MVILNVYFFINLPDSVSESVKCEMLLTIVSSDSTDGLGVRNGSGSAFSHSRTWAVWKWKLRIKEKHPGIGIVAKSPLTTFALA